MSSRSTKPPHPATPANRAVAEVPAKFRQAVECLQQGRLESAKAHCAEVLKVQPRHAEAMHVQGLIALQTQNPRKAVEWIDKSLSIEPRNAAAHCNRAAALQALGEWDAALRSFDAAIVSNPQFSAAYFNRGILLHRLGRLDDALASHSRALAIEPAAAVAHYQRALVLQDAKQPAAALAGFERASALDANFTEAYFSRGVVERELGRPEAALKSYERALALNPRHAAAHVNRGNVLRQLERWDDAVASYEAAIAIAPTLAEAHCNLGNVYNESNRLAEAIASYDRAIAINADYVEAHCNKAVALLLNGDLTKGWTAYEWRHRRQAARFAQPVWTGVEPLNGKSILLHSEQGLGDTLQFCRYVPLVARLGARVILEVQPPLQGLLASLDASVESALNDRPPPPADFHCSLLSLPLAFGTTLDSIPAPTAYLRADAAKRAAWLDRLGAKTRPRVGLVWAGSTVHRLNNRTVPLTAWMPHLPDGFHYVCLQKELEADDRAMLNGNPSIDCFADALTDFSDTAALCDCMDLVVTIDTSVAHLCGALGKRTWVMLPFNPDWRWLLDRRDSPWYPSATLYRQESMGDWQGVLATIGADLRRALG